MRTHLLGVGFVLVSLTSVASEPAVDKNVTRDSALAERFDRGQKWAVVIGVDDYIDAAVADLKYCVADARLLSTVLAEKCGYEAERILTITDDQPKAHLRPLRRNLHQQVAEWLKRAAPGDTVLVFFSGHGFLDERGQGFLATQDVEPDHLGLTALRTDELRDMLQQCKATQKLLVLDCCHAGGNKGTEERGPSSQELSMAFQKAGGLLVLASCDRSEKSLEWEAKGQGLFTWFLSEGLRGGADYDQDGVVDSYELHRFTLDKVSLTAQRALGGQQTPKLNSADAVGVFALARSSADPLRPKRLTTSPLDDIAPRWKCVPGSTLIAYLKHSGDPDAFRAWQLGGVESDGTGERFLAQGVNLAINWDSIDWLGASDFLVVAEARVFHENMLFDTTKAPFTRAIDDGNDAAFTRKLAVSGGRVSGAIQSSRDGRVVAWRDAPNTVTPHSVTIRTAPIVSLGGQDANAYGTVAVTSSNGAVGARGLALTPDGSQLILALPVAETDDRPASQGWDLWLLDGYRRRAPMRLTQTGLNDEMLNFGPEVSPDGRQILFQRSTAGVSGSSDIFLLPIGGGEPRQITRTAGIDEAGPSWSPDGTQFAFARFDTDNWNIYVALLPPLR